VCACIVYRRISSTGHSQVQMLEWDGDVGVCVYRCVCVYMDVRTCVGVYCIYVRLPTGHSQVQVLERDDDVGVCVYSVYIGVFVYI